MTLPRLAAGVAALQLTMALPALLSPSYAGTPVAPPGVVLLVVAANAGAAALLLVWGAADRRAAELGAVFALVVTAFVVPPLRAASSPGAGPSAAFGLVVAGIRVESLLPLFLWRFGATFPDASRADPFARMARVAAAIAAMVGSGLIAVQLAATTWPAVVSSPLGRALRFSSASLYWMVVGALALPALGLPLLRARLANRAEQRRVRLLVFGTAVGGGPVLFFTVLQAIGLLDDPWLLSASVWIVYAGLSAVPLLTAYAVLVEHALDVRLVVRKAIQYTLARYTLIVLALVPIALVVGFVYRNRSLAVAELFAGPTAPTLLAITAAALLALRAREGLTAALDRRFFRERYDVRRVLTSLVADVREAVSPKEIDGILRREIGRSLHPTRVALLMASAGDGWLSSTDDHIVPVSSEGPVMTRLKRTRSVQTVGLDPLEIRPEERSPESDWLRAWGVRLLVPLVASTGETLGVIALGDRKSELPYTSEDQSLLVAVSSATAMALEAARTRETSASDSGAGGGGIDDSLALECGACGAVQPGPGSACRICCGPLTAAALPPVVAAKFRLVRRLGAGGQGVVYLAEDTSLGRSVALKTLPRAGASQTLRLEREARVLASLAHPNLALVLGLEGWRGLPVLVLEYMRGGTLADELRMGAIAIERALAITRALCSAVDSMHREGMLHLDIKPSNIGFVGADEPKLMDFGLARVREAAWRAPRGSGSSVRSGLTTTGPMRGTTPYMSPEALRGRSPEARDDVWALAVVTWEMLAGARPFTARTDAAVVARILHGRPAEVRLEAAGVPVAVFEALLTALSPDERRRPQSASELAGSLRAVSR